MSDISAVAGAATAMESAKLGTQVQVSLLKKSLDTEKETAKLLLETLGIGQHLDVKA